MEEDRISISSDDCRRWSTDINDRLEAIRLKDGEDTYRFMFTCAFLLLHFAEQLEGGAEARLTHKKSELH